MTNEIQIGRNIAKLVKSGAEALKAAGWTDQQIIAVAPMLAEEAIKFLQAKAAA